MPALNIRRSERDDVPASNNTAIVSVNAGIEEQLTEINNAGIIQNYWDYYCQYYNPSNINSSNINTNTNANH